MLDFIRFAIIPAGIIVLAMVIIGSPLLGLIFGFIAWIGVDSLVDVAEYFNDKRKGRIML